MGLSCNNTENKTAITQEQNLKAKIGILIDSCWNTQQTNQLGDITTSDFSRVLNGVRVAQNPIEMEAHMKVFFKAFPDLEIKIDNIYYKDQKAFFQWNAQGTNTGEYGEVDATGKKVNINGLSHLFFSPEGKLNKEVVYFNELELLQQLGYSLTQPNLE